jgi:hypothetical protein
VAAGSVVSRRSVPLCIDLMKKQSGTLRLPHALRLRLGRNHLWNLRNLRLPSYLRFSGLTLV